MPNHSKFAKVASPPVTRRRSSSNRNDATLIPPQGVISGQTRSRDRSSIANLVSPLATSNVAVDTTFAVEDSEEELDATTAPPNQVDQQRSQLPNVGTHPLRPAFSGPPCICDQGPQHDDDHHPVCFPCLGPAHAAAAFTPGCCVLCEYLPIEERLRRLLSFHGKGGELGLEPLPMDSQSVSGHTGGEVPAQVGEYQPGASAFYGCFSHGTGTPPVPPLGAARRFPAIAEEESGLPTGGDDVSAEPYLFQELPALVERAATFMGVPMPKQPPPTEETGKWHTPMFAPVARKVHPSLPPFPTLSDYVEKDWASPTEVKSPIPSLRPLTRVQGWNDTTGPEKGRAPPVSPALAQVFHPESSGKQPPRPDRATSALFEKSYALAAQGIAAESSVLMLASYMHKLSLLDEPTDDDIQDIIKSSAVIVRLAQASVQCMGGVMAVSVTGLRDAWLSKSTVVNDLLKKELVSGPVSRSDLFGLTVPEILARAKAAEEAAAAMKVLTAPNIQPPPPSFAQSQPSAGAPGVGPNAKKRKAWSKKRSAQAQPNQGGQGPHQGGQGAFQPRRQFPKAGPAQQQPPKGPPPKSA